MRILMVAPQPFFQARGTPFSVLQRVTALTRLGHTVDMVTYPIGQPVLVDGLTIHRAPRVPFVRDVRVGPSIAKIFLDVTLLYRTLQLLRRGSYDLLHTHEEAAIMGAWLSRRFGLPHLYDMHSSLPEQFGNFERYDWWPVKKLFARAERYTLDRSDLVITVCPALDRHIERMGFNRPNAMIENTYELEPVRNEPGEIAAMKTSLGIEGKSAVVYTGTLEAYQGIDLMLAAVPLVREAVAASHFVIVGGTEAQAEGLRRRAAELGIGDAVSFVAAVPPNRVSLYHGLATVLVTCRVRGVNTPLKIYEYMRAGKPIVATAIHSHTQVLDEDSAELVPASAAGVAQGLIRVLTDSSRAKRLAEVARATSDDRYGSERYLAHLAQLLSRLPETRPRDAGKPIGYRPSELSAASTASGDGEPTAPSSVRR